MIFLDKNIPSNLTASHTAFTNGNSVFEKSRESNCSLWTWITTEHKFAPPFEASFQILKIPNSGSNTWGGAVGISKKKFSRTNERPHMCWEVDPNVYAMDLLNGQKIHYSFNGQAYADPIRNVNNVKIRMDLDGTVNFVVNTNNMGEAFKVSGEVYLFVALINPGAVKLEYVKFE